MTQNSNPSTQAVKPNDKKLSAGKRWAAALAIVFLLAGGVFAAVNNGDANYENLGLKTSVADLGDTAPKGDVDLSGYKYDSMRDFMANLPEGTVLIENVKKHKYHELDCKSVKQMKGENARAITSWEDVPQSFDACKNCNPQRP